MWWYLWVFGVCLLTAGAPRVEASQHSRYHRLSTLGRHHSSSNLANAIFQHHRHHHHQQQQDSGGRNEGAGDLANFDVSAGEVESDDENDGGSPPPDFTQLLRHQRGHHKSLTRKKRINNKREMCLFQALRRCGNNLITQFSSTSDFQERCTTKEEFLDCMSMMQHGGCHVKHLRHGPSKGLVEQYQQRLRRLLRSTRGCIIGIDLSEQK